MGFIAFQDSNNAIWAVSVRPDNTTTWGGPPPGGVGGSRGLQYAKAGSAVMASPIWLGPHTKSPYSVDIWWQANGSSIVEGLDASAAWNIMALPVG